MMYYCVGINTIILLSVSQLGTLFASDASFWCYININELYIKKRLFTYSLISIRVQGLFSLSPGSDIRPHFQSKLSSFFPNFPKKFPI